MTAFSLSDFTRGGEAGGAQALEQAPCRDKSGCADPVVAPVAAILLEGHPPGLRPGPIFELPRCAGHPQQRAGYIPMHPEQDLSQSARGVETPLGDRAGLISRQKGRIPCASASADDDLADSLGRVAFSPVRSGGRAVLLDRAAALAVVDESVNPINMIPMKTRRRHDERGGRKR